MRSEIGLVGEPRVTDFASERLVQRVDVNVHHVRLKSGLVFELPVAAGAPEGLFLNVRRLDVLPQRLPLVERGAALLAAERRLSRVDDLVVLQLLLPPERLGADGAGEGPVRRVDGQVPLQVGLQPERFLTERALERPFRDAILEARPPKGPVVGLLHVSVKICLVREPFVAHGAAEALFPRVSLHVAVYMPLLREPFVTDLAAEGPVLEVSFLVFLKVAFVQKHPSTLAHLKLSFTCGVSHK